MGAGEEPWPVRPKMNFPGDGRQADQIGLSLAGGVFLLAGPGLIGGQGGSRGTCRGGRVRGRGRVPVNAGAPLDGLTVLEVSSFVAAPLGGLTLAQLGADVIRVDRVGGGADQRRSARGLQPRVRLAGCARWAFR